ncbi:hypothetical protein LNQ03_32365 [Klebsiella pneumoniae subsp. pneumoniae]|nr:hypothetical protein [Klebsiella pneumoniae subsp. pneumoniae]
MKRSTRCQYTTTKADDRSAATLSGTLSWPPIRMAGRSLLYYSQLTDGAG